jgi:outer membrane protein OmpA-like peptidoglycan-associated protein
LSADAETFPWLHVYCEALPSPSPLPSAKASGVTLTSHADPRGSVEYNQVLTERRVNRTKAFLVAQGVPENAIETNAMGKEQQLSANQAKALVEQNLDLSDAGKKGTTQIARNRSSPKPPCRRVLDQHGPTIGATLPF